MIFIPDKKFIFLEIPKTGTTTASNVLLNAIYSSDMDGVQHTDYILNSEHTGKEGITLIPRNTLKRHCTLRHMCDRLSNLEEALYDDWDSWKIFATIRDPVARARSRVIDFYKKYDIEKNYRLTITEYCNILFQHKVSTIIYKQMEWLKFNSKLISHIILFDNLKDGVNQMLQTLELPVVDAIPVLNVKEDEKEDFTIEGNSLYMLQRYLSEEIALYTKLKEERNG